jgi:hypothetical protein
MSLQERRLVQNSVELNGKMVELYFKSLSGEYSKTHACTRDQGSMHVSTCDREYPQTATDSKTRIHIRSTSRGLRLPQWNGCTSLQTCPPVYSHYRICHIRETMICSLPVKYHILSLVDVSVRMLYVSMCRRSVSSRHKQDEH